MDFERARFNMVEQQIRPWEVLDQTVLDLLFEVKREAFVPEKARTLALADLEMPIGHGEFMWAPKMEARVLQELAVKPTDRVLEVGTGSGYLSALLARLAEKVVSLDIVPELAALGERNLQRAGCDNVTVVVADGARGWDKAAPYDVIVLTGSTPVLPDGLLQSLNRGGRLFAVIGDAPVMKACLYHCVERNAHNRLELFETVIAPLKNALKPNRFVF
jgi:protein-L-isoaspartate(D-aspartate) O-methyltransferase